MKTTARNPATLGVLARKTTRGLRTALFDCDSSIRPWEIKNSTSNGNPWETRKPTDRRKKVSALKYSPGRIGT